MLCSGRAGQASVSRLWSCFFKVLQRTESCIVASPPWTTTLWAPSQRNTNSREQRISRSRNQRKTRIKEDVRQLREWMEVGQIKSKWVSRKRVSSSESSHLSGLKQMEAFMGFRPKVQVMDAVLTFVQKSAAALNVSSTRASPLPRTQADPTSWTAQTLLSHATQL